MRQKWIWISSGIVLFIVVSAASINLLFDNRKEVMEVKTAKVEFRQLNKTILASGQVFPSQDEKIYLDTSMGKVVDLNVKEGQKVNEGNVLFRYKNNDLDIQIKQYEFQKKRILIDLEQQNKKIKRLEKEIKEGKENDLPEEAIKQLTREKEDIEYQNRLSNLDYSEILNQIESTQEKKNQLVVKSPITGVVKDINEDSSVANQSPFMYIISTDPYIIKGTITEYDVNFLKVGQPVTIRPKAFPNKTYQGQIKSIETVPIEGANNNESVASYIFSASIENVPSELQIGFHVSVEIEIEKEKTLVVPSESVKTVDDKSYIFIENKGIAKMREVVTGETHSQWIEIVSGVKEGETIITNKLNQLSNNMEVKVNDTTK
ncbi:efflux RND transporter periplasmic adaptor subunit [Aeribacillus alveayuensis]|uniref:HlyD family secretion protein n=1 Tax=Aeribacillus alveayuensis TaxID=279215 RepID=A0ABT9VT52_9BACI|nr:HlyD family secretion protein [Bacillus alveayuensis]